MARQSDPAIPAAWWRRAALTMAGALLGSGASAAIMGATEPVTVEEPVSARCTSSSMLEARLTGLEREVRLLGADVRVLLDRDERPTMRGGGK